MLTCWGAHNPISRKLKTYFENTVEPGTARTFFRGSETTLCPRKLAYARKGVGYSNPFSPDKVVKMKMGDVLHNWIRGSYIPDNTHYVITNWDPQKEKEEFLFHTFEVDDTQVSIGGHIDGIVRLYDSPFALGLLEVKTTGRFGYASTVKTNFQDSTHYSWSYIRQANRYVKLWNLAHENPEDQIDAFCIFLFNTDGSIDKATGVPHRDYWFEYDEDLFVQDLEFFAKVAKQMEAGEVDRGFTDRTCFECDGCTYHDACWGKKP